MNTYVKIGDMYLHVFIYISDNVMFFRSQQGLCKAITRKIKLDQIQDLYKIDLLGSRRLTFTYEKEDYQIYNQGLGVLDYLERNLYEKVRN